MLANVVTYQRRRRAIPFDPEIRPEAGLLEKLKICFGFIIVTSVRATAKIDTVWPLSDREAFNLFSAELYEKSGD
jgi:hypothetical protein